MSFEGGKCCCLKAQIECFFSIRDQSSSATYYYKKKTTKGNKSKPPAMDEEWMYYRKLKPDENEQPLRWQQVFMQIF